MVVLFNLQGNLKPIQPFTTMEHENALLLHNKVYEFYVRGRKKEDKTPKTNER